MSVDLFLGLPFNIASYALLTHILANVCNLKPGKLTFIGGDVHIYNNHITQVGEMISRVPYELPTLETPNFKTINDYIYNSSVCDYKLNNYNYHPTIKASMAV